MLALCLTVIDKSKHTRALSVCPSVQRIPNSHSRKRQPGSDLREPSHSYCVIRGVSVSLTRDFLKEANPVPVLYFPVLV